MWMKVLKISKNLFTWFVGLLILRLIIAYLMPIVSDEAYYFSWSLFPDLGYFDHPPMVAWLGFLGNYFPQSPFASRFFGVLMAVTLFPISYSLFKIAGIERKETLITSTIVFNFSLIGMAFGMITTPDTPMFFGWALALHEAAAALKKDPRRWLTAGIATGVGLWGKYLMLLIGPVFLFALLKKKDGLKSPWPYLGGVLALLVFLPHLYWNANNDWISLKFQVGHGFRGSHEVEVGGAKTFPQKEEVKESDIENKLGSYFSVEDEKKKRKTPKTPLQKSLRRVEKFIGGQLVLWGIILLPLFYCWCRRIILYFRNRKDKKIDREKLEELDPNVKPLFLAATWFPLIFFGVISIFQKVEANWSSFYTLSAAALITVSYRGNFRTLKIAAFLNICAIGVVVAHAVFPETFITSPKNRILDEAYGFKELSEIAEGLDQPVFADTYQIVSMLNFYSPKLKITQLPGITRHSEFVRRSEMIYNDLTDMQLASGFWLITKDQIPPKYKGFTPKKLSEIRDCFKKGLIKVDAFQYPVFKPACEKPVHVWYLIRYQSN